MINKLWYSLLLISILLITTDVSAQVLENYWQQAEKNYKGFSIKKQQVVIAQLDSASALDGYKPQVWVQYQQSLNSLNNASGAFYPMPGIFNVNASQNLEGASNTFNQYASSSINLDLINFGRKNADKALGGTAVKLSQLESEQYRLLIQNELSQRYINYLYYQILNTWHQEHLNRYSDILELTRDLSNSGVIPTADTLLVSSSINNARAELLHVSGLLNGHKYALSELTGVVVGNDNMDERKFFTLLNKEVSHSVTNPILAIKSAESEKFEQMVTKSRKELLPQVLGIGALSSRSSGVAPDGNVSNSYGDMFQNYAHNYFVGVGLSWNLHQLFRAKSNRKVLEAKQLKANEEYALLTDEIEKRTLDLGTQEQMTAAGLLESNRSREEALEAYEIYKVRYEGGLINLAELLQVQSILLQNERSYLQQYYNYWNIVLKRSFVEADLEKIIQHF